MNTNCSATTGGSTVIRVMIDADGTAGNKNLVWTLQHKRRLYSGKWHYAIETVLLTNIVDLVSAHRESVCLFGAFLRINDDCALKSTLLYVHLL